MLQTTLKRTGRGCSITGSRTTGSRATTAGIHLYITWPFTTGSILSHIPMTTPLTQTASRRPMGEKAAIRTPAFRQIKHLPPISPRATVILSISSMQSGRMEYHISIFNRLHQIPRLDLFWMTDPFTEGALLAGRCEKHRKHFHCQGDPVRRMGMEP